MSGGRVQVALALLGATLTTYFFSELLFWNEGVAQALLSLNPAAQALFLGYYGFCALVLAAALSRGAGPDGPTFMVWVLAGCLFGWIVEAAVVPAAYESPPGSFLWTSVAWHMPVDVVWGVWLLPMILRTASMSRAMLACAATGVGWGVWATWIWVDTQIPLALFAQFVLLASLPGLLGLWLLTRYGAALSCLKRPLANGAAIAALILFALTGSLVPVWGAILGAIVVLTWGLIPARYAADAPLPPAPAKVMPLFLIPICALGTYAICVSLNAGIPTTFVVMSLVTGSLGMVAVAIWQRFTLR